MPDIDIDFCMNRRGEVINYVTEKYGRENVAQIITFGTMAAKAAIKDVGRAMDMPYADVDRIAKMVPTTLNITLDDAIRGIARLCNEAYDSDPQVRELLDTARKLEGMVRNAGVHAAGVVISPRPLTELVPLHQHQERRNRHRLRHGRHREDGPAEDGLPGADHADHLDDAVKLIKQTRGEQIDLADPPARRPRDLREGVPQRPDFRRLPV